ncbi:MAG TPA: universal stress protein [Verrucomicrobiae bacterium]|nr:universal stress protein [Verrucomicrobiae bacterium]
MEIPPFRKPEWCAINSTSSVLQLRRILVPIDFRDTTVSALCHAAAFARQYKATITLLHIVEPVGPELRRNISRDRLIEELSEVGESQIRKLVDVIWGEEIVTDVVVAGGKPYQQIVNEARETNADMIIMANHGAVGSWGFFRRGTTAKVIRHAPCPVLVVPALEHGFVMARVEKCPER